MTHSASWRSTLGVRLEILLQLTLIAGPLAIGLAWGDYLNNSAYATFRLARDLALGRGLDSSLATSAQAILRSPLSALALTPFAWLRIPLPQAGLILSVLGWGATAVAIYAAGKAMGRPRAGMLAAALVVASPLVVSTLGTEIPWTVGLAGIAIASTLRGRWTIQGCALVLMLAEHFEWSTLLLTVLLLAVRWTEQRRFPAWLALVVVMAILGWGLMAVRLGAVPLRPPGPDWAGWSRALRRLLDESEFYWLFLPFVGAGLLAVSRKSLGVGLLWSAVCALIGGPAAGTMLAVLGVFLAGLGIDLIVEWVATHNLVQSSGLVLVVSLAFLAGLPLGVAEVTSLLHRFRLRPVVRHELEEQAADWLRANSEPTAVVLSSERVGYLADRPTLPWDGSASDQTRLVGLLEPLTEAPPQYCVSRRSIGWDLLMRTVWFEDGYEPLQQFQSPYDASSPFAIWGYRLRAFEAFDVGGIQPLHVHMPGGVNWVGYSYGPDRIEPGGAVRVTLFLQASRPVTEPFRTVVQLISPVDGTAWAQRSTITPHDVPVDSWESGQVVAEQFVLTTTVDVPIGAYRLNVSVAAADSGRLLPMHRRDDTATLDRVILGYVAVPWQGDVGVAKPVGANFGDQINLLGFEAPDRVSPGAEFDVKLYWETVRPPEVDIVPSEWPSRGYGVVFVHLLDANGQLGASHDGPPMGGRYPTEAWLPGDVIPDVHTIALDPGVPAGTYRLMVGMYQWPGMERLTVWDGEGVEQPDRVLVLQSIEVQ